MKQLIKNILKTSNIQIIKYSDMDLVYKDLRRRLKIVNHYGIDVIFDIGAATGDYAKKMREFGYTKKIISFEPLTTSFKVLKKAAEKDGNWIVNNYALGNENSSSVIHVSGNSDSSSLLNILPVHVSSAPQSVYISEQNIEVRKLDSIFNAFCSKSDKIMLKIDTQGYEKNVLEGACEFLKRVSIIQLEMSIVPLYEEEMLFYEMIHYLNVKEFQLFSLENGFSNPQTGQLLQVDGIFVKEACAN
jgi:FkbM family methyltransferase